MTHANAIERAPAHSFKPIFSYRGMDLTQIERLRFDSNFEVKMTEVLTKADIKIHPQLLVTTQGKSEQVPEGVSLVSYNRFSVTIAYFEPDVPGLGIVYMQIGCRDNVGAAESLFERLKLADVPGGEAGCTAEPEQNFVARRNLAGQYAGRENLKPELKIVVDEPTQKIDLTEDLGTISQVLLLGNKQASKLHAGGQSKFFYRNIRNKLTDKGYRRLAAVISANFSS